MKVEIYQKRLGINFIYLIKAEGVILVDVGLSLSLPKIKTWFSSIPIDPSDVNLVVITHAHFDHAGAAAGVKELTGASVAIHHTEKEMLTRGSSSLPIPASTLGKVGFALLKPMGKALHYPGIEPDLVIGDEGMPLEPYGIPGRILYTPGHTQGSLSVLLDNGDAFVGCMTHNAPPFRLRPNHPIFADDLDQLWKSWTILLDQGAKTIYPGHGKPFTIDKIQGMIPDVFQ